MSSEELEHVLRQESHRAQQKAQSPSNAPQHYAIFVDENQIRVSVLSLVHIGF